MGEEGKLQSVYKINGKMLIKLKKEWLVTPQMQMGEGFM